MKEIRLAGKIIGTLLKSCVQYPSRFITDSFALAARCGILLILYGYVFALRGGVVNGTTYQVAAWSMFFYFAFSTLRLRDISISIMRDVQLGNIENLFNKPVSYLLYRIWWQIGLGLFSFLSAVLIGVPALALVLGIPTTMTSGAFIFTIFLAVIGSAVLSLLLYVIVGLLAFWIEEITPVFWLIDKAVMILGGSYLPVALFPDFLYKLAVFSPFGASQFISHTVYESWRTDWFSLLGIQLFWIMALGVAVCVMFSKARQLVSVNGG